ncbi:hemagglutinin repeat-containing protein [Aggregatibacter segnis]|uniref:two-partner secretion domain-containing protein n=1 Tax=Aggregatibacter segnis TaxID=739 RepID=UPI000D6552B1|nr:hemagglutinin repeat-containing protein [Aggregatibacter segnis]
MNKKHYKVIFSQVLNQLVVVSELAKSKGKATSENVESAEIKTTLKASALSTLFGTLTPVHFSIMLALGFVFVSPAALANADMAIRADKSAPGNQQPTVLQTANGLPQVNIQTPSAGGVSRNQYSQFDVAEKGAVLNNARKAVQTQTAGWVQGNPNLAAGEAKVILNEVNSSAPSQLKGYVEVAGQKADVVIANPSGIHCDGCGVINAGRATMTTGKAQLENGELKGYEVNGGKVKVTGKGMDNRQADYTDIIAENAQIDGGVWSKKAIKVTTGKNKVDRTNDSVVYVGDKNTVESDRTLENPQAYSVDVSQLGGMYAEKIHLVDNGQGLGVRNAGHIGASAGEVNIDSQGRIVNSGHIQAQQDLHVHAQQSINNQKGGHLLSHQGKAKIESQHEISQSGVIGGKQEVTLSAKALTQTSQGEIQSQAVRINTKETVNNRGLIQSRGEQEQREPDLIIKADRVQNTGSGRIYGNQITIGATTIINEDELNADGIRQDGIIAARDTLTLGAQKIHNKTANYVASQQGASTLYGEKGVTIAGSLNDQYQAEGQAAQLLNESGTIESSSGAIRLNVADVVNRNLHFRAEIENQSDEPISESYVIPKGYKTEERIDYALLKWIPFSRAGKLAFRQDGAKALEEGEEIRADRLLPTVNEYQCQDYTNEASCRLKPESVYGPQNPAWAYFGIQAPTEMPAGLADIEMPEEPIKPTEVEKPRKNRREKAESYAARLADYEKAVADYNIALANYEKEKATYETRLNDYQQAIAPFKRWIDANEQAFNALQSKIAEHNQRLLGKTFSHFWITKLNQRVIDESVVKTTLPGQILAGGDIAINGAQVLNDRSQMISGGRLSLNGDVRNEDETGYHVLNEYGTSQWTADRWRGGVKRYFQRDWGSVNAYNNHVTTEFKMGVAQSKEQVDYRNNSSTHPSQSQALMTKANEVLLPSSSLYRLNPETEGALIETDPAFTDRKKWLNSDYMFTALRSDPQNVLKRLGDGYYEQHLVRDQINQLTGKMFLGEFKDLESQYKALMDNGITFAKKFNLTPGVALSAAQVAQLTSDIVWFEEKTVTLPSGKQVNVMAPRVYAMVQPGDINGKGSLLSGEEIDLHGNQVVNSGTIVGRKLALLNAESLFNEGAIQGEQVGIQTKGNFDNIGGTVEAEKTLVANVGGNLTHRSTTATNEIALSGFQREQTTLARKALFHVKGEDGTLHLSSNKLEAQGADIINEGKGATLVQAKTALNLTALSVGYDEKMGGGNDSRREKIEKAVVSHIKGKGDVTVAAKDLLSEGARLESAEKLTAIAENDLVLNGAKESSDFEEFHQTKSGSLAKTTKTSLDKAQLSSHVGTQLSGKDILLSAGKDVKAKGLQGIADKNLSIQAGEDVVLTADTNRFKEVHQQTKKTSGVFTSGGGITFGSKSEKHHVESEGWTQSDARSTLGAMDGNVKISAGNHAQVMGTDMITPKANRIDVEGASVKVEAGKDIVHSNERHEYKQGGLTLAVSSPVIEAAQSVMKSVKRSGEVKNARLKQLHQLKAAYEVGSVLGAAKGVADTLSSLGNMNGGGDISSPSVKISVSVGASQSKQTSETKTITHQGSELNTGTLNLTSRKGNVDVLGSHLNAKRAEFDAAKNLNIESLQDTYYNRSENKNSGWSVGVFLGMNGNSFGLGIEGSAQVGKGRENSDSITQRNSYINAQETVIKTGHDANFKGAVVNTDKLDADIKGNLNLESRQDSNHYDSKQTQAGAGFSVAIYGTGSSASANYSQSKAKLNYAQVEEQTGFHVGKGGMDVKVAGNTHLAGSVIDSEADQDKNRFQTKSLSHTDIENRSEVEVKSVSAGLSTNMAQNAKNAMAAAASALGNKHESATSQTQSAIGSNIQIDTETPENLTALSRDTKNANHKVKAFDLQEIKEQQEAAQVAGELFSKITGDVAKAFEFEDGSKEKIAMHALAGALAAKMSGGNVATGAAAGAGSEWLNTYVTDYLNEHTKDLKLDAGQKEKLKQAAQQMTALAIGAAAGAVTGGTSETIKQGALTSYNAETYNRQLHQNEKERIKLLANGDEEKERRLEIAACALIHCSAQIPTDDPDYAKSYEQARAVEQLGNTAEYAQERALLKRQTETFSDPFGSGVQNKLFEYNNTYKALDHANRIDTKYAVTTRAGGVVQAVGGVAAMAVGTGLCETGIGCVAGVPVAAYGADNTYTGGRVILTGKNQNTLGGQLLSQVTGLSPETANFVYSLPSLYTGAKPILGATARLGNQVVAEGSQMASAMGYVAGEIGKDIASGYRVVRDTATKTSVNTQLAYTDLVGKSVNGVREYVRTGVKNMEEQGTKVALTNAVAAGGIKAGFEANDYANGKSLTRDNLLKSTKEVGYSFFSAGATTGMPIFPVIGLGVTVDWAKDSGNYDIVKTTGSNILSSGLENKFGHYTGFPLIKEAMTNSFEKYYEQLKETNKHEK